MLNGVRYFPLPYIYVGDNVEDFMLGGMSGTVSDYPSPFYLAHKDELDKTKKTFQRRSEADQKQVGQAVPARRRLGGENAAGPHCSNRSRHFGCA